jgi:Zn-dependent M28 family amino/carboxypeptidase
MILIGTAKRASPLLPSNWPADESPQLLAGRMFAGHVEVRKTPFTSYNVVAIARGSEARFNKTYVAYGAHYDHVGIQPGMKPDSIANGADDDGSGSVTLLAIAKSTVSARPRRSTLFVWHAAEEKGLLGSAYFTTHPTVPIDSIVAQINSDMIGRRGGSTADFNSVASGASAANRLYVIGPRAAPNNQSRVLGAILDSVNARQARPLEIDGALDAPNHPERYYERSDHYNYALKGIPVIMLSTGFHEDYHKVSDEASKIDFEKMARIGSLMLDFGITLANRESRPR